MRVWCYPLIEGLELRILRRHVRGVVTELRRLSPRALLLSIRDDISAALRDSEVFGRKQ